MGVRRRDAGGLMKGCFSFMINVNLWSEFLCFTVCHNAASFLLLRSELSVYLQCVCVCACVSAYDYLTTVQIVSSSWCWYVWYYMHVTVLLLPALIIC